MTAYLLDANVVIASVDQEHVFHDRVERWLAQCVDTRALCPIVEGALLRHLVRLGRSTAWSTEVLADWLRTPGYAFWPDDLSYRDADLSRVRGHRQVAEAHLVALAVAHGGVLATLDEGLHRAHPAGSVLVRD